MKEPHATPENSLEHGTLKAESIESYNTIQSDAEEHIKKLAARNEESVPQAWFTRWAPRQRLQIMGIMSVTLFLASVTGQFQRANQNVGRKYPPNS
jgi:hypothetical protein